jgi:tetratricopeptide (TPR) repeat protein
MNKWLLWILLSALTGNPILAAAVILIGWWAFDRFTFRVLPDPVRWIRHRMRASALRRALAVNPHDRRARFELADLLISFRRHHQAVEILRPNLEAGDDDVATLYLMGVALLGAGHAEQGELILAEAIKADPSYRVGALWLERGRYRLLRGDAAGAKEDLEKLLQHRQGTVEGRVLLARAKEAAGDAPGAAALRTEAWGEYRAAPRFKRREERFWAWRARPSRPILYAAIAAAALFALGQIVAPAVRAMAAYQADDIAAQDEP